MAPLRCASSDGLAALVLPRRRRADDDVRALEQWWLRTTVNALDDHHLYFGLLRPDGAYEELYAGPNLHRLLGGTPAAGEHVAAVWQSRIETADVDAYRSCEASLLAGVRAEVDYRVRGLDGVTRWIRAKLQPQQLTDDGVHFAGILADVTHERRV